MKKNIKSKSKSRGKEKIKVKASQNTEKKQPNTKTPQIKPVSLNKLQDSNRKTSPPQKPQEPPTKEIKDEKPQKIEELFKGADNPQKYDFNLHKHLKENLKFKDKQCKDGLTKESLYCLDCKISLCPKCKTFSSHNNHSLILKYPYYNCNDSLINENFVELKVILVGRSGTGKTNIINALTEHKFNPNMESTLTNSFLEKKIVINKKEYNLEIWDTAGQEKFRAVTRIFIKDSKIVIFVYDITNIESFKELDYWVKTVKDILGDEPVYGLAGNKKDLIMEEKIDEEKGKEKAEQIGAKFKLTSAKNGVNGINEFMKQLLEDYIIKNGGSINDEPSRGQSLEDKKIKKRSKWC